MGPVLQSPERQALRSRTVTYSDPRLSIWTGQSSTAIEHLLAIRARQVPKPPLYELLRIDVLEAQTGRVTLTLQPDESFTSPLGLVAGGIILTVLDTTLAWACDTMAPADQVSVTVEMKTNFLKPIPTDAARLLCEAECVFSGSHFMVGQAKLRDEASRVYAIATGTFTLIARKR